MSKSCECECECEYEYEYECSRSSKQQQQRLQDIQVIEELQEEITLLQIYNEKLNGDDDYCGVSYTELLELESLLRQGFCSVEELHEKALDELRVAQATECDLMGNEWVSKTEEEDFGYHWGLGKRRRALRLKARELRLSAGDSPQEHSRDPDIRKEVIDSLKSEKERLRLWNQRMIGKEIDGMGCHELRVFSLDIQRGLGNVRNKIRRNEDYVIQVTKHANGESSFCHPLPPWPTFDSKLNGDDLCGLSYTELQELESLLLQGMASVSGEIEKMSVIESLKREKERLWLWNQRMIGEELDGMVYHELTMFHFEIGCGLTKVRQEKARIRQTNGTSPGQI
ncbi:unnamed protein product [Thlaspi arvense]|uniref:Uncharacterized protein n=1 Tax=Thlaspi arvense TaxID=13288 RepID=A0AAU9S0W0_THLAR|nr:unnamed protein product [Thlaspi arvense]